MLYKTACTVILVFFGVLASAQENLSFYYQQLRGNNDTLKMIAASVLAEYQEETDPDSAMYYSEYALRIAQDLDLGLEEVYSMGLMGYALINLGNYPRSLQTLLNGIELAKDPKSSKNLLADIYPNLDELNNRAASPENQRLDRLARLYQNVGILYGNANNHLKEKSYYLEAKKLADKTGNVPLQSIINGTLGRVYLALKMPDSALVTEQDAYNQALKSGYMKYRGSILLNLARVHAAIGNEQLAIAYFQKARDVSAEQNYLRGVVAANLAMGEIYEQSGKKDSALYFFNTARNISVQLNAPSLLQRSYRALSAYYRADHNSDSIVKYQGLIIRINDSLFNTKQAQQFQNIDFDAQQRQMEKEAAEESYRYRLRLYGLLTGLGIVVLVMAILWRNNRHRQKAYALLAKQKQETEFQKTKVEQTLAELQATQKQLIQSEKMASLGELTAGIAHEIQNPLNFVNNFSEVNRELLDELLAEANKGNVNSAKEIAAGIVANEEKIMHHGKRAEAIVKNMLQHSRASTGRKEPTDINALCDEYVRLAFHGLRAKDKSFHAHFETHFDTSVQPVAVVTQDMGRVLLNVINNAFYAVSVKASAAADARYLPTVKVTTKKLKDKVAIEITDNGDGIPASIREKIFQPFFTTKPSGEGTGLGLSLSYDIVKAHGGNMSVDTREGEGATFTIHLPLG